MKKLTLLVCLILSFALTNSDAKIPKPQPNTYVNDFAGILKPAQIASLNEKIHRIERLSTVQIALVLVNKIPDEYDIEDYTLLLARKWHVGKNKNGFVYVAAIDQRKQRIEVGRELNGKLTNAQCKVLLSNIKPYFKEKNYDGGLQNLVRELGENLAPATSTSAEPAAAAKTTQTATAITQQKAKKDDGNNTGMIIGLGVIILVIWIIARIVRPRKPVYAQPQPGYGGGSYNNGYAPQGGININNYGGGGGSGIGSGVGGFVAGAATGYAVRSLQDRLDDGDRHDHHDHYVNDNDDDEDEVEEEETDDSRDDDPSDYGNWGDGSNSDTDEDEEEDDNSSSSDSGYDGDRGATSDW